MNDDLETSLGNVPVSAVPESLDAAVEVMIRRFESNEPRRNPRRVPLWAAALACTACAVLGFVAYPLLRSTDETRTVEPSVIYIENLSGDLPDLLGGTRGERQVGFFERKHTAVRTLERGQERRQS